MRRITITAALAAMAAPAQGQTTGDNPHSGNGLNSYCQQTMDTNAFQAAYCVAFIGGVVDALDGVIFCTPSGSTYGQYVDVVKRGLASHPEERQKMAASLVAKYLHEAWPCPVKS